MKYIISLVLIVLIVIFGFWLITSKKQPQFKPTEISTAEKPLQVLFLELTEINRDTFKNKLFVAEFETIITPFYLREGRLAIDKEAVQAIKEKRDLKKYRLFVDKPGLDIEKEAKLFLIYNQRYEGIGRNMSFTEYYIFNVLPAKISVFGFNSQVTEMRLAPDESIGKTFDIRILPGGELIITQVAQEDAEISFAGKKSVVSAKKEELLARDSKKILVSQEFFAPVPKGKITEDDIKIETAEFGEIEFSTDLKVINHGLCQLEIR